jgi:SPP1 family predicted phage head-tail adaptor
VVIRYRSGVLPAMRVIYQGRVFDIQSVIDVDTQHRRLALMCSEGLNQG